MVEKAVDRKDSIDFDNRRYVMHEVDRHIKLYRRYRRPFSLLLIHVHNLDWLDDTFGAAVGNAALGYVADLINANAREVDIWCMCMRHQFLMIMEDTAAHAAQIVAERLAAEQEKTKFELSPDGATLEMSFSTASCPDDAVEAAALLRAAGFLPAKALRT
jgi:diguanylate cyclase (GGDEF)-like protein